MNQNIPSLGQKRYDRQFGFTRLTLLLLQLGIVLSNELDQNNMHIYFPQMSPLSGQFNEIKQSFSAANTMGLVFIIMQLIILYVGTNRFRVKPTIYIFVLHVIGCYLYWHHSRWQYQNIWIIFSIFSFLPVVSEIAVALYTATI